MREQRILVNILARLFYHENRIGRNELGAIQTFKKRKRSSCSFIQEKWWESFCTVICLYLKKKKILLLIGIRTK